MNYDYLKAHQHLIEMEKNKGIVARINPKAKKTKSKKKGKRKTKK